MGTVRVTIGILIATLLVGCSSSDFQAWKKAQETESLAAYQAYLRENPRGKFVAQAHVAVEQIDDKTWDKAEQTQTPTAMSDYLSICPEGKWAPMAREWLEHDSWNKAKRGASGETFRAYLKAYPDGRFTAEAHDWLDARAWEKVEHSTSIEDLSDYLKTEPKHPYATKARERIKLLAAEKLASVLHGEPITDARTLEGPGPHQLAILNEAGKFHEWHSYCSPDWRGESPQTVALVVILSPQKEIVLSVHHYQAGGMPAPSITRYKYELRARVFEAKTGKVLAEKHFQTIPRPAGFREPYSLTRLGTPVTWTEVQSWLRPLVLPNAKMPD